MRENSHRDIFRPLYGACYSSTEQADGGDSDCILKPVSIYRNTIENTFSGDSYIVLCEVMNRDGTPHSSNTRSKLRDIAEESDELKMWFGIEQEYLFMDPKHDRPYGWPKFGFPSPQGRYYCGVGGDVVRLRNLVEFHAIAEFVQQTDAGAKESGTHILRVN